MAEPGASRRDLGVPFDGTPGPLNAITDVRGVEVGHATMISGDGKLAVGHGRCAPASPRYCRAGKATIEPVFAGWFSLNGNGEMTGTTWIEESGLLEGPVDDHQHAQRRRGARRGHRVAGAAGGRMPAALWSLPVVAET